MNVHVCLLDRDCRENLRSVGVPWLVYVNTRRGSLLIALRPRDRMLAWLPWVGYLPQRWWAWWFVVWQPSTRRELERRARRSE